MITTHELRGLEALRDFSSEELAVLLGATTVRAIPAGATLWRQGELGGSCMVVVRGALQAVRERAEGDQVIATLWPGAIVGQLALVDHGPRGATVRALGATDGLELSREAFERLLEATSPLALRFQRQVAMAGIRQLRGVMRRLAELPRATPAPGPAADAARRSRRSLLRAVQAVATEWGITLEELEEVEVVVSGPPASHGASPARKAPRKG